MKKYEYTGEQKEISGVTLHQIRAVRDFGGVHAGEIGGWIGSEKNLSHKNDAWVFGDARVYGRARVYGGKWEHSPCFIQGTRWSMNVSSPDTVRCGCQDHSWEEWHNHYAEISRSHNGDDVLDEYIQYFNLLCGLYGHEDCTIVREECNEKTV